MASRSMAVHTAWRNFTLFMGAVRLFIHSQLCGAKNSQPLVVTAAPGSLDRRDTSKYSTVPPGAMSTLPDSNAAARAAASGIT